MQGFILKRSAVALKQVLKKKTVREIIDRMEAQGHKIYIIGGAVRDAMRGVSVRDVDLMTSAKLDQIIDLFPDQKTRKVGQSFPICLVNGIEISSSRSGNDPERLPESDLAERDFTINAMAFDPVKEKIHDPFNGKKDLEKSVIRFTRDPDQRIKEDPVRMIRACRFCAMIQGSLSISSFNAILSRRHLIQEVASERISSEIKKAMALDRPSLFFRGLKQTRLLEILFPSLDRCVELDGGPYHGETVFEHCMMVGDALSAKRPLLRLAGFLHDTGKFDAAVLKNGNLSFPGHEKYVHAVVQDLEKLRFPKKEIQYISSMIQAHMRPLTHETTSRAARRLLAMLELFDLDYRDFLRLRIADKKGNKAKAHYTLGDIRIRLSRLLSVLNNAPALNTNQLKISGDQIIKIMALEPGPEVGRIKQQLFEQVLDHPEMNQYEELAKRCRLLKTRK